MVDHVENLKMLADQAVMALERYEYRREFRRASGELAYMMGSHYIFATRDPEVERHTSNVMKLLGWH